MAAFSTIDALNSLYTSIPDWSSRLDVLNGQIAFRQIELARLEEEREERGATPRSIRNKGSTESLRPKDGNENNISSGDTLDLSPTAELLTPRHHENTAQTSPTLPADRTTVTTPTSSTPISSPRASPGAALTRQTSQSVPPANFRPSPAVMLKKRKTESLASGESLAPKYRTRSMIIVYYDSAVQTAFEELVKFVSGSRNAMRKGKMAAKMAEMRRAAELEAEDADDDDVDEDLLKDVATGNANLLAAHKKLSIGKAGHGLVPEDDDGDSSMPKLRYLSTRNMGMAREYSRADNFGSTLSVGLLRGYRRGGVDGSEPDIFDQLDKGLEWCQSQCELAAHQFLRDGDCNQEIENIKRKLVEVKETAGKEVERRKKEEAEAPPKPVRQAVSANGKSRELKSVQMRKDLGSMKALQVGDMEVDEDEGLEDMEPPKLIFKRSRDISNH